ncbi:archease [Desulfatitalea alkaliphila]|uniref:Archease n=1 Tax=Desulfatitalea alkaliphila TaxID=2929485 RepID=A0AA41R239_9BACT|nr:archease [Desulfatitalea alkaliphila]MCJ8499870.1 archease [Desulfatitalea alkaliphila]
MAFEERPFYRLTDHTADLGMEIFGDNPTDLFANAARALFAELLPGLGSVPRRHVHHIEVEGADPADLMVNWLRELLYLFNGEGQVLCRLEIRELTETELRAEVETGDFLPERHSVVQEIKAVTYHRIQVAPEGDGWRALVVFDV